MQVEVRGDSVIIDGYVNAVGRDSRPIRCQTGDFVEQVEPGVFGKALKRAKNIKLLLNHRTDRELGSTAQGNLTLTEDNIGLKAHAEVGDPEIIRKARNNQLSGWSFGMYVNESEMEQRSNTIPRRRLKDIDMFEVSIIDTSMMPCYAGTSVECRAEGENALLETRAFEDTVEMNETLPENYFEELEARAAQLRAESELADMEKRIEELRYNPYHDPTNGRFTTASGSGGGYLFVGKGEKGKGSYVFDSKNFKLAEVDIDCSKDENFVTSSRELLWESIHLPKNYKENLDHGDLEKDEYDELMSRVLKDVKENQVLNFQDNDGKSYTAKGTSFLYNGSKYGMIGRKKNNFVVDHNSKKIFPIRQGYNSDFTKKSLSNNIISAIETQNFLNSLDKKSERAFNEVENKLAQLRAESELVDIEKRIEELRYNPYHDPTNGRFTTAQGSGGGYLFVGKGEKGKGQYVFDRDIDSEYEEWKKSKGNGVSAEDKAVREATGGVVQSAAKTTVEATVRKRNKSARPEFDKTVLEAKVDSDGNIILDYAKGDYSGNYGDEYQTVTYNIQSGFVDGEPVNLDLSKAKTISGKTYDARQAAKASGMTWDSTYDLYISKDHLYNVDTTFSREKFEKMSDAEVDRVYHATAFKSYLDSNNYTFAEASAKAKKLKPRSKAEQIERMEKADKNNKLLEQQREKWAKTPWAGN